MVYRDGSPVLWVPDNLGDLTKNLVRLRKENPGKLLVPASEQAICPDMKLIRLEKVVEALQKMQPELKIAETIRAKAGAAIDRMLAVSR